MPFVQFTDASNATVSAAFPCHQNEDEYPGQMQVSDNDPRYVTFMAPKETMVIDNPIEKLKAFLAGNPDVALIIK